MADVTKFTNAASVVCVCVFFRVHAASGDRAIDTKAERRSVLKVLCDEGIGRESDPPREVTAGARQKKCRQ